MITPPATPPSAPGQMPASGWDIQAPASPGSPQPITVGGNADAGGRDDVAASVAEAVSNAQARYHEHMTDTYGLGSTIGDIMTLPPSNLDPGVGSTGTTEPAGGYYDPPRNYDGSK